MDEPTIPNRPARGMQGMNERLRATFGRSTPLRILAIILLIVLVGVAIFAGVYASRQPRPTFATAHVGNVILSVQTTGSIQATVYQADFPVDGALSQIDVTVGQQVHKGDALAKLNVAPFQSALTAAQNAESAAQQSLYAAQDAQGQSQNSVDSSESALSAQQSYAQNQCASAPNDPDACAAANAAVARGQAQVDAAQAQLAAAQAQAAAAQTVVTKAQTKSQIAQAQLAATTLAAPHDGVVTSINGSVGGRPGATANGLASFITIMDTTAPLATASVGYGDIGTIKAGQSATFRVKQASASAIFTGVVTGVSPLGQGVGSALSYPVSLRLDPASLGHTTLLPGMTADISIITHARYHVVVISNRAVRYAEQAAPTSGKGLLTAPQISAALTSAQALKQEAIAHGFDAQSDPLTPTYLIGFAQDHYVAIPVVLGLTDGQQWEVVAGLHDGQQVVNGQRSILFG
ncbi:MAG TPA: HlyD family efflux transporter periplasmic adaptor subunit [Ktedonobacterales bacterium]